MMLDDALRAFGDAAAAVAKRRYPGSAVSVGFEAPRRPEFGDFASNVAFSLAKIARKSPQGVAELLAGGVFEEAPELSTLFTSIEPVAGFVNLRVAPQVWRRELARILREGASFGAAPRNGVRISLEFGSANPTGPLVVVQGRSMSIGDDARKRYALPRLRRFRRMDHQRCGRATRRARALHLRALSPTLRSGFPLAERRLSRRVSHSDRAAHSRARRRPMAGGAGGGVAAALRHCGTRRARRRSTTHGGAFRRDVRPLAERTRTARNRQGTRRASST